MTKRQFSFLLGLISQTGCIVYDDALERERPDVRSDGKRDSAIAAQDAMSDPPPRDVLNIDAVPSGDTSDDVVPIDDGAALDVRDASTSDADVGTDAMDVVADVAVDPPLDAAIPDVGVDMRDAMDADLDTSRDVTSDPSSDRIVDISCPVDFNVSGVTWPGDTPIGQADGATAGVRLVGDIGLLGAWQPTLGLQMTEKAPGSWSLGIALPDALTIEFKFVKINAIGQVEWEAWLPNESNRSFKVDCGADGGTTWVDASTDAGPRSRATGRSYGGAFGVKPPDATK